MIKKALNHYENRFFNSCVGFLCMSLLAILVYQFYHNKREEEQIKEIKKSFDEKIKKYRGKPLPEVAAQELGTFCRKCN